MWFHIPLNIPGQKEYDLLVELGSGRTLKIEAKAIIENPDTGRERIARRLK